MAGKVNWECARQDYLLAKQLQGLSQQTLEDYDNYTGRFIAYLNDNNLKFTTPSIRSYLASLNVGQVTLGIRIKVLRTFCRREPVTLGDIRFEAFGVEHSTRAPAVGYRVTCGRHSFFYAPDLVYIYDRQDALSGVDMYIGDGSTVDRSFVRKRGEALIGHSPIRTELTWCHKEGVPLMIVTHCGAQIVGADDEQVMLDRIDAFAAERSVKAAVAFDGMELLLR